MWITLIVVQHLPFILSVTQSKAFDTNGWHYAPSRDPPRTPCPLPASDRESRYESRSVQRIWSSASQVQRCDRSRPMSIPRCNRSQSDCWRYLFRQHLAAGGIRQGSCEDRRLQSRRVGHKIGIDWRFGDRFAWHAMPRWFRVRQWTLEVRSRGTLRGSTRLVVLIKYVSQKKKVRAAKRNYSGAFYKGIKIVTLHKCNISAICDMFPIKWHNLAIFYSNISYKGKFLLFFLLWRVLVRNAINEWQLLATQEIKKVECKKKREK